MVEVGPGSAENEQSAAHEEARPDFSAVQGFQVVGGEDHGAPLGADQAWRDALRLELAARAARLHQAVDAAIVLSNDAVIRWLGDPVARLARGPNVLSPGAVILADESAPDECRDIIKARIELWLAATTRRMLGPLFALEGLQEGSEIVRDLARELVRSLGVLEREPIRAKIKALSQDERAELRKQGVRFGAYYIFVPALIKPAPRDLALQLWGLQAPGDVNELLRSLGPVASSGRTSLPVDKAISKEGYRVAGYRVCGERVVRVDVVERLAGMIRAAIGGEGGAPNHRAGKGFVVSGEMTSLTGCSGDQFASILRSMSFRPAEMKRSDFFGPPTPGEAAGQSEAAAPPDDQRAIAQGEAPAPAPNEEEPPAEAVLAAPAVESAPEAISEEADAAPEQADADAEGGAVPQGADAAGEGGDAVAADTPPSAVSADPSDVLAQAPPQPSGSGAEPAKNADMIIVWRPDHRRISPNRRREAKPSRREAASRAHAQGHEPGPAPEQPAAAAPRPAKPNRPDSSSSNEKRRHRPRNYDMARSNPATAPEQKAKVDPNSPFAKLLELRPLLEEQASKRQ